MKINRKILSLWLPSSQSLVVQSPARALASMIMQPEFVENESLESEDIFFRALGGLKFHMRQAPIETSGNSCKLVAVAARHGITVFSDMQGEAPDARQPTKFMNEFRFATISSCRIRAWCPCPCMQVCTQRALQIWFAGPARMWQNNSKHFSCVLS